jgi:hypothetical protein
MKLKAVNVLDEDRSFSRNSTNFGEFKDEKKLIEKYIEKK